MMRILFLFFLIPFLNCDRSSELPALLKCADKSCIDNVSTGRILQHSNLFFGDLKEIKKSTKVNIKGKNADENNSLWLIESNGLKGFLDLSLIKENINSVVNDLEVVNNPFYVAVNKGIVDETEDAEDQSDTKLFSTIESLTVLKNDNIKYDETEMLEILPDDKRMHQKDAPKNDNLSNKSKENKDTVDLKKEPSALDHAADKTIKTLIKEELDSSKDKIVKDDVFENNEENQIPKILVQKDISGSQTLKRGQSDNTIKVSKNLLVDTKDEVKDNVRTDLSNKESDVRRNIINDMSLNVEAEDLDPKKVLQNDDLKDISEKLSLKRVQSDNTIKGSESSVEKDREEKDDTNSFDNLTKDEKNIVLKNVSEGFNNETLKKVKENNDKRTKKEPKIIEVPIITEDLSFKKVQDDLILKESKIAALKTNENVLINNDSKVDVNSEDFSEKVIEPQAKSPLLQKTEFLSHKMIEDSKEENIYTENQQTFSHKLITPNGSIDIKHDERIIQEHQQMKVEERIAQDKSESSAKDKEVVPKNIQQPEIKKSVTTENIVDTSNVKDELRESIKNTASTEAKILDSSIVQNKDNQHISTKNDAKNDEKPAILGEKASKDSDPWLVISDRQSLQSNLRSPILRLIFYVETSLYVPIQSLIKKTGLDSSIYLTGFVHNWLCMSLENFVLILSLTLSIVIIVYTPKMFRWNRDWKSEFEKQSQLIMELESKLTTIENVRQKLTIHNSNFEKVIDEYKGRVNDIQDDANNSKRTIMLDLERMKKINEINIQKLNKDLEKSVEKCKVLERHISEKNDIIDNLNEERNKMEIEFTTELSLAKDSVTFLKEKLLEVDDLKEVLNTMLKEKAELKVEIDGLSETMKIKDDENNKLRESFKELKICEGLDEEEYHEKIDKCIESYESKARLEKMEEELSGLNKEVQLNILQMKTLENQNEILKQKSLEYEEQRLMAVKNQEAAEMKLKVLTDYFHQKELEMQKSLGHESVEKSLTLDQSEIYKHKIENLEIENNSMSKTILKLKNEVKDSQSFAVKCKNDANTQIANQFMTIANLERELMIEKEESKKLRLKLSYYIGPNQPRNVMPNQTRERPPSRQSGVSEIDRLVSQPPMFPLGLLPQTNSTRPQYSGRNSANSVSKKSNNS